MTRRKRGMSVVGGIMNAVTGVYSAGKITLDTSADWPDGCRVVIEPVANLPGWGLSEEEWQDTPEAVADWLRWYDTLEPLEFTAEEETDLAAWRRRVRERSAQPLADRAEELFP